MARARTRRAKRAAPPPSGSSDLQHELSVHQEELRAQNEKLVSAMQALEETRDRYIELYDFAPNGYMTLDSRGFVREINLFAASMMGSTRDRLVGLPILRYIPQAHRARFLKYLSECRLFNGGSWPVIELPFDTADGRRTVQLTCRPRAAEATRAQLLLTTIVDVSEQRRLEGEREQAREEHARLVRQMLSILERERQRIARDIHDDLGQQVTWLRLKLDWLASLVGDDDMLRTPVANAQAAASGVDRHIDYLLRELRPAGLDDLGLVATLQQAVREWSLTFGVSAEFRCTGVDKRLSADTETHVFRIVQEALNNVHKHAGARAVMVRLERRGATTVLSVADDGVGFEPGATAKSDGRRGLGLIGMRERAALIGGELQIRSQPRHGTTLILRLS